MKNNYKEQIIKNKEKLYKYYEAGNKNGHTILLLHGLGSSKEGADKFCDLLLTNYRCIFLDLPAHAGVLLPQNPSLSYFTEYVLEFGKILNLNNYSILGFSFGGLIALDVARVSSKVKSVILWATPVNWGKTSITKKARLSLYAMSFLNSKTYKNILGSNTLIKIMEKMGIRLNPKDVEALRQYDNSFSLKALELFDSPSPQCINIPTLLIYSKQDVLIDYKAIKNCSVPSSKLHHLVEVPNGGHFPTNQGRIASLMKIIDFIESNKH